MSEPGTVSVRTLPLWRIRLERELPRYLAIAALLSVAAAGLRVAVAPPRYGGPAGRLSLREAVSDRGAEAFAVQFARRYLTWNGASPQASSDSLGEFVGPGLEAAAGLVVPATGEQSVQWAEVVQARAAAPGEHVYTVAAQTDSDGLLYLTVPVARAGGGDLALAGYPAFVGPPASAPALAPSRREEVADAALSVVVERALRNYLAGSEPELAADLAPGARVSAPAQGMTLDAVQRLDWSADRESVIAQLKASDARGAGYTLTYELDVSRAQGRWEITAIQMEPYA